MIKILNDSGADTSSELTSAYNPTYIPLTVILGDKEYRDGIDISLGEVHDYMKAGNFPKTSQITPHVAIEALEKAAKAGDSVIFITLYSQISGTYQVAVQAMKDVKERYPDFKCAVIDSKTGAGGQTVLYLTAMEMVEAGHSFEEIADQLKLCADQMVSYLVVEDLNWLVKGGRLPKTVGKVGSMLKVKPLLTSDETGIIKDSLVRGSDRAYFKMIEKTINQIEHYDDQLIVISHVAQKEIAEKIKERVLDKLPKAKVIICNVSAVIASHIGIGGVGVFTLRNRPELFYPISI